MSYRLGLDVGTNSLGWAALTTQEAGNGWALKGAGSRITSASQSAGRDPKTLESLAVARRGPRAARRNRDRSKSRLRGLMRALIQHELMPANETGRKALETLDPWILRYHAVNRQLELPEIGRAIFHLASRRGFKSNRKTDAKDSEAGKVKDGIRAAKEKLESQGVRTLGELFGKRRYDVAEMNKDAQQGDRKAQPPARVRTIGEGAKERFDYYPSRDLIEDEFTLIWEKQAKFYPAIMTDSAKTAVFHWVHHQRPLETPKPGRCTLETDHPRAPKALPSEQRRVLHEQVNQLAISRAGEVDRPLTKEQKDILAARLMHPTNRTAEVSWPQIRKTLDLPRSATFNLESERRKKITGDVTAAIMMQDEAYGPEWLGLPLTEQDTIVEMLLSAELESALITRLKSELNLSDELAERLSGVSLPVGYGRLSRLALAKLLPELEKGLVYSDGVKAAGYRDHSQLGDGIVYDLLPYYGEILQRHVAFAKDNPDKKKPEEVFGKIANPTVHVQLNEIRKVVNDLINRFGKPDQIVLELARDLPMSKDGIRDLERKYKANQEKNEARKTWLNTNNYPNTYDNRLRLRLYEELPAGHKSCVYSGQPITETALFSDSVEIDHILPFRRSLDDSAANKVLCLRQANRDKGDLTPHEKWGDTDRWDSIAQRAAELHKGKARRFDPDAMEGTERRFAERQITDTRYIGRLAADYLACLYGGRNVAGEQNRVWVTTGRLTSDLRHYAGLNTLLGDDDTKSRDDHRHHAVDAAVVAATDPRMVQKAAQIEKRQDRDMHREVMDELAEPLRQLRSDLEAELARMVISHKPDHGYQGAMHNDTALGITEETDDKNVPLLVTRKPLSSFTTPKQLEAIRDPELRDRLLESVSGLSGKDFTKSLVEAGESMRPPVRRVRILAPMKPSSFVRVVHGQHEKAYKGDGNYCYDIFKTSEGKWDGEIITTYQAYQLAQKDKKWWQKRVRPNGSALLVRLRKGDMLELADRDGVRTIWNVYKFSNGKINLSPNTASDASARIRNKTLEGLQFSPNSLRDTNPVRVTVSPSGTPTRYAIK